jgi:hypothetical protein
VPGPKVRPSLRPASVAAGRWRKKEYLSRALFALFVLGETASFLLVRGPLVFAIVMAAALFVVAGLAWAAKRSHVVRVRQLSQDGELTVPAQLVTSRIVPRGRESHATGRLALARSGMEWRPTPHASRKGLRPIPVAWEQVRNIELTPASPGLARGARLALTLSPGPDMVMVVGDYPVLELAVKSWWRDASRPGTETRRP